MSDVAPGGPGTRLSVATWPVQVTTGKYEGIDAIIAEDAATRLTLLPSIGAKVVSLVDLTTGREYLARQADRPLVPPRFGDRYERYDIGGWDECFPSISAVAYPEEPWRGVWAPDHGELWTLPWEWLALADGVRTWVDGVRFPYRFTRTIRLAKACLTIGYEVLNRAPFPFSCLWSMHPMFALTPAMRLLLPRGTRLRVEYSKGARLGAYLSEHAWPCSEDRDGVAVDLGAIGSADQGFADKLYTTTVRQGAAALLDEQTRDFVVFRFDPATVPFVGLAVHRGGWPETGQPSFSAALEPCTGWPDRLDVAIERGVAMTIPPRGTLRWSVQLHHGRGRAELERVVGTDSLT
ncbi:MAG: hypothetical protein M1118_14625 [Chloroflexi bacterium]|nr:hypothetical protein [Chloroflexota bacterium]